MCPRFADGFATWLFIWRLLLLLATLHRVIIASDTYAPLTLEAHPEKMFFLVNFAVERYEHCDPDGFGTLDINEKRSIIVKLFLDHGLMVGTQWEEKWPELQEILVTQNEVVMYQNKYDWTRTVKNQSVGKSLKDYYHRNAFCVDLLPLMGESERIDPDGIKNKIWQQMAMKYRDYKVYQYVAKHFYEFRTEVARNTQSAYDFLEFWFKALLVGKLGYQYSDYKKHYLNPKFQIDGFQVENFATNFKQLIEGGYLPNWLRNFGLWPTDLSPSYLVNMSNATDNDSLEDIALYYAQVDIGPLDDELLLLLAQHNVNRTSNGFLWILYWTSIKLLRWSDVQPGDADYLAVQFISNFEIKFWLLATEDVYQRYEAGTLVAEVVSQTQVPKLVPKTQVSRLVPQTQVPGIVPKTRVPKQNGTSPCSWCKNPAAWYTTLTVVLLAITVGAVIYLTRDNTNYTTKTILDITKIINAGFGPEATTQESSSKTVWILVVVGAALLLLVVFAIAGYFFVKKRQQQRSLARRRQLEIGNSPSPITASDLNSKPHQVIGTKV